MASSFTAILALCMDSTPKQDCKLFEDNFKRTSFSFCFSPCLICSPHRSVQYMWSPHPVAVVPTMFICHFCLRTATSCFSQPYALELLTWSDCSYSEWSETWWGGWVRGLLPRSPWGNTCLDLLNQYGKKSQRRSPLGTEEEQNRQGPWIGKFD